MSVGKMIGSKLANDLEDKIEAQKHQKIKAEADALKAATAALKSKSKITKNFSYVIIGLFVVSNVLVLPTVLLIGILEAVKTFWGFELMTTHKTIFTEKVIMSLLAATTVQLGFLAKSLGIWVYGKGPPEEDQ